MNESKAQLHNVSREALARRIHVALGQEAGDLCLRNGRIVNVFTRTIQQGNVVISDGYIAGVGNHDWQAVEEVDLSNQYVIPGLIDAHMHLESTLVTPAEFARLVVPRGTVAVIADPHEIANVLGVRGIEILLAASQGIPLDCYMMASPCVPASPWENAGATLDPSAISELLDEDRILGLAEMMNFPGVINCDTDVLEKLIAAQQRDAIVDGHCPGLLDQALVAYTAAGVRSDHECTTPIEAEQRAALGMTVQVREGSMARNLDTMLPLMRDGKLGDWVFCTDDILPEDLIRDGHIDGLLQRAVAGGVSAIEAVCHATLIPARHYGLSNCGAVSPSYRADLVVMNNLESFDASLVLKDGRIVARDGKYVELDDPPTVPIENTVRIGELSEDTFRLKLETGNIDVIGVVPDQIVTTHKRMPVHQKSDYWQFNPNEDVALIACIQRHTANGDVGLGLVCGFNFQKHGALGSTVAHDAHNMIITGTNAKDMLCCAEALAKIGGGFVAVQDGTVNASLPLPLAGLISTEPADEVCRQLREVDKAAASLGCQLHSPFGTLSFLGLSVIPELRITDQGMFDVTKFQLVSSD